MSTVIAVDTIADVHWDILDAADAIVFGSADVHGQRVRGFQAFAEQTGRRCLNGAWRDKVGAGSPTPAPRPATSCTP